MKKTNINSSSISNKIKGAKEYEIHDNGARPFCVLDYPSKKKVEVYLNDWVDGDNNTRTYVRGKKIFETSYKTIFIGDNDLPGYQADLPKGTAKGNSILVNVSDSKYIYIGDSIYSFETRDKEKIVKYYSPVGNSDVPYPYAVGENYTYFLLDSTTVPNNILDLTKDAYTQYYGYSFGVVTNKEEKEIKEYNKNVLKPSIKKFKHKVIHKRRFG